VRQLEDLPPRPSGLIQGEKTSTIFTINGVQFHFDALAGQKTGAFLDQRENYAATAQYCPRRSPRCLLLPGKVLPSIFAPRCSRVTESTALVRHFEVADQNAALNGHNIEWIEANAFDLLKDYSSSGSSL